MLKAAKVRADQLLVDSGITESRTRAQALIMAGKVFVGDTRIEKAGHRIPADSSIRIVEPDHPYVSRGGIKLEHAIRKFDIEPASKRCLDIGASTGGFTDCLLKFGASSVIAVDVGYGQLHSSLREDKRVFLMERTNARYLKPEDIGGRVELAVVDCSFISLSLLIPSISQCLLPSGELIALVKPQFEAGRDQVGRGGVVRDEKLRTEIVKKVENSIRSAGFDIRGSLESPIAGPAGNIEYLLYAILQSFSKPAI